MLFVESSPTPVSVAPKHTGKDTTIGRHARVASSVRSVSLDDSSTDGMGINYEEKHKEAGIDRIGGYVVSEDVSVTSEDTSTGGVYLMTKERHWQSIDRWARHNY